MGVELWVIHGESFPPSPTLVSVFFFIFIFIFGKGVVLGRLGGQFVFFTRSMDLFKTIKELIYRDDPSLGSGNRNMIILRNHLSPF